MRIQPSRACLGAIVSLFLLTLASPIKADVLQITVTNNQPTGGFAFSPVWVGLQNGSFSTFTPGSAVSPALQAVAELADTSKLTASFAGNGPQTTIGSAPYGPGSSASTTLNVTDTVNDRYLSYASMVVPSNDFFMANSDPKAFALFDSTGHFNGPMTIQIFGTSVWDAGSEVNNINFGAAFIVGDNITDHVAENGTIQKVFGGGVDNSAYLNSILGKATPYGYNISHLITSTDLIATIQISAIPEPSSLLTLGGTAIGGIVVSFWRSRKNRLAVSAG